MFIEFRINRNALVVHQQSISVIFAVDYLSFHVVFREKENVLDPQLRRARRRSVAQCNNHIESHVARE